MPSRKPFLSFVIDLDLLKLIDDFRYQYRFPTRAGTIKWLLRWALAQAPEPPPDRRAGDEREP